MPRITYTGPHDEVEIPSAGVVCKRGESVDVPDELGVSLLSQPTWQAAKPATVKKES